ncbi:MAG: glycerophosphodiester phosphodiesterase, partial [Actinomycetota bacterium]
MSARTRRPVLSAPQIIAHRGASRAETENTLAAFRTAGRMGADAVELDVRRTLDGAMAVHHDDHLADGRNIVDLDAAELPSQAS